MLVRLFIVRPGIQLRHNGINIFESLQYLSVSVLVTVLATFVAVMAVVGTSRRMDERMFLVEQTAARTTKTRSAAGVPVFISIEVIGFLFLIVGSFLEAMLTNLLLLSWNETTKYMQLRVHL